MCIRESMNATTHVPRNFGKKDANKRWRKTVNMYVRYGIAISVFIALVVYAEWGASLDRTWAISYNRRCEACQAMIVSGVLTKSLLFQQERKRIQHERELAIDISPEATNLPLEEPKIHSSIVVRHMCLEQQIDALLSNYNFVFGNGYAVADNADFKPSLVKLCWLAMKNSTMTQIFKQMLEVSDRHVVNPTLVSLSRVHFESVCVRNSAMCTAEELKYGEMVDPNDENLTIQKKNLDEEDED